MVVRAGRAGVLLDPPHRRVLVHPAGPTAGAVQRPWSRWSHRESQPGAGPQARRPKCHGAVGQAGRQVRPQMHERHSPRTPGARPRHTLQVRVMIVKFNNNNCAGI